MKVLPIFATATLATTCCEKDHLKGKYVRVWLNVEHCNEFRDFAKDGLGVVFENLQYNSSGLTAGGAKFGNVDIVDKHYSAWAYSNTGPFWGDSDHCWWDVSAFSAYSDTLQKFKSTNWDICKNPKDYYQESSNAMTYAAGRFPSKRGENDLNFIVTVTDDKPTYSSGKSVFSKFGSKDHTLQRRKKPDQGIICNRQYRVLSAEEVKATLDKYGVIPITVTTQPVACAWKEFYERAGYAKTYVEVMADSNKEYYTPGYIATSIQRGIMKAAADRDQVRCS